MHSGMGCDRAGRPSVEPNHSISEDVRVSVAGGTTAAQGFERQRSRGAAPAPALAIPVGVTLTRSFGNDLNALRPGGKKGKRVQLIDAHWFLWTGGGRSRNALQELFMGRRAGRGFDPPAIPTTAISWSARSDKGGRLSITKQAPEDEIMAHSTQNGVIPDFVNRMELTEGKLDTDCLAWDVDEGICACCCAVELMSSMGLNLNGAKQTRGEG